VLADPELMAARLDESPVETLVKLFTLGVPVSRSDAEEALGELPEVVRRDGDAVVSEVGVTPYQGLYVVHDRRDFRSAGRPEVVTGVNAAAKTLARLTVRRPIESALDIGAGSGLQTLLAARHAGRVLGTDVNERALRFLELNARLNGLVNVECRSGSLFEPVADERYDLVVSNPPYVLSPDTEYVFRDSGRARDDISRDVAAGAPAHLREGGYATVLCNWVVESEDEPAEHLAAWVEGRGCDAWVLHYGTEEAAEYAAKWNDELRVRDAAAYAETVERWIAYYAREGIERIGIGGVVLRRRDGTNWTRVDTIPFAPTGAASDQILRVFEAQDHLADVRDDERILAETFALVEPHRVDQTLLYRDGEYVAQEAALLLEDGVGARGRVDPHAVHVLFGLDGERPLGELVAEVADATGLDPEVVGPQALATVRRLYELGFVVRAG
jgi:methylase of polypeptide subunit release factors